MKKQLRLLAWILSLTMLCELLPFSAFAQSDVGEALASTVSTLLDETNYIVDSGTCGDNLSWSLSNGVLTISGTGDMDNYMPPETAPWNSSSAQSKKILSVVLESGITSIGAGAFMSCNNIARVTIPSTITKIESLAFSGCISLSDVYYDKTEDDWNAITIGSANDALTNASIHYILDSGTCGDNISWDFNSDGTLTVRGTGAMDDYSHYIYSPFPQDITSLIIEDGITKIGDWAFCGKQIQSISLPDSLLEIGYNAFQTSSIKEITLPKKLETIDLYAFFNCKNLTSISIPDSVTFIGAGAFSGCNSLTNISVPDSVTSIDASTFSGCSSLTSISIPDSVTSIGASAFYGCSSLTSVSIPDSVTSIGASAFYGCSSLTSISIPDVITSIEQDTFSNCGSLTSITIPISVTSIGVGAFSGCSSLTSISIPTDVTSIGNLAFADCIGLTSIFLPEGVTSIGEHAFDSCNNLASIFIPKSVTSIGKCAFDDCTSLSDIYYSGTQEQWKDISIDSFIGCLDTSFKNATIHYNSTGDSSNPEPTKKEFEFKKDNLSFLNSPDYFFKGEEKEYWYYAYTHPDKEKKNYPKKFRNKSEQYGALHISEEKFKQITANLSPSVLDWIKLKVFSGSVWGGSCYGMTTVAAIHYMTPDKLPLGRLFSANLFNTDPLFLLPAPVDNTEAENLINYYYLAQLLPTRYKIFSNYLYNCANNFDDTLKEVVNSLAQGIPVIANTSNHSVLLINIKETNSDNYVLGVYDPNESEEQSMILYKTPYISDENEAYLHISYGNSKYLQFYILASDSNIVDIRNYFGLGTDNESETEYNDAHITIDANKNSCVIYGNQYYYRSKDGVLLEKNPKVSVIRLANQLKESSESDPIELILPKPSSSEDVKLELSSEGINEASMILNHATLAISSTGPVDVTYNEQNQTLDLTSDDPVDISLMLTQNDTTENWPWHSWAIDTTGTTTLHAELTDEGLKLSGDGLNNAAFATENADTEDVQTSTISAKADSNTGVASVTIKNNQDSEGNNTLEVTQPSNTTKPTAHTISVTNGSASVTSAASGEIVTITAADKSAEKKVFTGWTVNSGNVTLDDSSASTTSFVMGSENVSIIANYKTVSTTPSEPTKPTEPDKPETPSSDDDGSGALILLGVGAAAVAAATAGVVYMMPVKIQGKVESGDHVAIPNAKVSILKNGNIVAQVTADENGNFEFKVKRGTYELTAAYTDASGQLIHQTIQQKAPAKNVVITF